MKTATADAALVGVGLGEVDDTSIDVMTINVRHRNTS